MWKGIETALRLLRMGTFVRIAIAVCVLLLSDKVSAQAIDVPPMQTVVLSGRLVAENRTPMANALVVLNPVGEPRKRTFVRTTKNGVLRSSQRRTVSMSRTSNALDLGR